MDEGQRGGEDQWAPRRGGNERGMEAPAKRWSVIGERDGKEKRPDRSDKSACDRPSGSKSQGLGPRHQKFHSHPPFPPRNYPRPPHTKHAPPPHVPMSTEYPS